MSSIMLKASIAKAQISLIGGVKGKVNTANVAIGGKAYGPGSLRFDGFAGSLADIKSKRYDGVMRFTPVKLDVKNVTASFSDIVKATKNAGTVTEDVHV